MGEGLKDTSSELSKKRIQVLSILSIDTSLCIDAFENLKLMLNYELSVNDSAFLTMLFDQLLY
jgi:hypothetical protein